MSCFHLQCFQMKYFRVRMKDELAKHTYEKFDWFMTCQVQRNAFIPIHKNPVTGIKLTIKINVISKFGNPHSVFIRNIKYESEFLSI